MNKLKKILKIPADVFRNKLLLLVFLNGFLLALLVYFHTENNYEKQLFGALATQIAQTTDINNMDSVLANSLYLTHRLQRYRLSVFGNKEFGGIKSALIRPVSFDLMTANGACGSYSYVLCRLLNELGIKARFAQMKAYGIFGAHIILEAQTSDGWAVLDPMYNLSFRRPDGKLASFSDVQHNWAYYRQYLPQGYDTAYAYEDVRYTNWTKIPVVMPLIKRSIALFEGKEAADTFSFRTFFLKKFKILFNVTLFIYIIVTLLLFRVYIRRSAEIGKFNLSMFYKRKKPEALKQQGT